MKTPFFSSCLLASLFFVLSFCFSFVFAQNTNSTNGYCHFVGTINGNLPIVMDLTQSGTEFTGNYYYTKYNLPIHLQGERNKKGEIEFVVYDDNGEKVESILGKISQNTFLGDWYNKDKSKKLPISLVEDYSKSISFKITSLNDSTVLLKNKEETPKAVFSQLLVELNQVPQGSNLAKIQEIVRKKQNLTASQDVKQVLEGIKKDYFKEYLDANKDMEEEYSYMANWEIQVGMNVLFNDAYFTTLSFFEYQYSGGAHGGYNESFLIIDTKNAKEIKLEDIFDKNALVTLQKRMLKKAYAYTNSENATSLEDAGYLVDKIEVTDNFSINSKGITFVYQQYEIAPYAMGLPSFTFTWDELKDIIKADSPINPLFKK